MRPAKNAMHPFAILHKKTSQSSTLPGLGVKKSDIFLKKPSFSWTGKNGTIKARKRKARSGAGKRPRTVSGFPAAARDYAPAAERATQK